MRTISQCLVKVKTATPADRRKEIVYKVPYKECGKCYIRETQSTLNVWLGEHKQVVNSNFRHLTLIFVTSNKEQYNSLLIATKWLCEDSSTRSQQRRFFPVIVLSSIWMNVVSLKMFSVCSCCQRLDNGFKCTYIMSRFYLLSCYPFPEWLIPRGTWLMNAF